MKAKDYLNNGDFLKFKYPESLYDEDKLFFYSIECNLLIDENSKPFDAKRINYQTIVEINEQNKEYLDEFIFLFCKPSEEDIIDYLCKLDRFEDAIAIKNGKDYSNLLTKEQQKQHAMELWEKIKNSKQK
jgi:hypothetical protein